MFIVSYSSFPSAGPTCLWNSADNSGMTLSNGDLDAEESSNVYVGIRATTSKASGKWYIEYRIVQTPSSDDIYVGLAVGSAALNGTPVLSSGHSIAWRGNGGIFSNAGFTGLTTTFAALDNINIHVDTDTGKYWCRKEAGTYVGGGDPTAGTSPTGTYTTPVTVFPMYKSDNSPNSPANKVRILGHASNQINPPASGYTPFGD